MVITIIGASAACARRRDGRRARVPSPGSEPVKASHELAVFLGNVNPRPYGSASGTEKDWNARGRRTLGIAVSTLQRLHIVIVYTFLAPQSLFIAFYQCTGRGTIHIGTDGTALLQRGCAVSPLSFDVDSARGLAQSRLRSIRILYERN